MYAKEDVKEPEIFIELANSVHVKLIEMIFNKE